MLTAEVEKPYEAIVLSLLGRIVRKVVKILILLDLELYVLPLTHVSSELPKETSVKFPFVTGFVYSHFSVGNGLRVLAFGVHPELSVT